MCNGPYPQLHASLNKNAAKDFRFVPAQLEQFSSVADNFSLDDERQIKLVTGWVGPVLIMPASVMLTSYFKCRAGATTF